MDKQKSLRENKYAKYLFNQSDSLKKKKTVTVCPHSAFGTDKRKGLKLQVHGLWVLDEVGRRPTGERLTVKIKEEK